MTIFIFLVTIIQNPGQTPPLSYFTAQHLPPPAELKQASKMLGWEIPSPLEENPTHTYAPWAIIMQGFYKHFTLEPLLVVGQWKHAKFIWTNHI